MFAFQQKKKIKREEKKTLKKLVIFSFCTNKFLETFLNSIQSIPTPKISRVSKSEIFLHFNKKKIKCEEKNNFEKIRNLFFLYKQL